MRASNGKTASGFTLIELLLVVAIIGLIASIALIGLHANPEKRLDTKRVTDVQSLQKALSLYLAAAQTYPVMTGCISGTDLVTTELRAKALIGPEDTIADPSFPSDVAQCYFYDSKGSTYTLRYTLQTTSSAGMKGNHPVVP